MQALTAYIVERTFGSDEVKKTKVWQTSEVLVPVTAFSDDTGNSNLKHELPIDIVKYFDFATAVREELRFSPDLVELTMQYNVNVAATTPHGNIEDTMTAMMVIPVGGTVFEVDGLLADQREAAIMTTKTVVAEEVFKNRQMYAIATGVLFVVLLLSIFITATIPQTPFEKKLHGIMKKYGDRIVSGQGKVSAASSENMMVMNSFEDLVKVSDDLIQPIFYKTGQQEQYSFYVLAGSLVYVHTLEEPMEKADMDEPLSNAAETKTTTAGLEDSEQKKAGM